MAVVVVVIVINAPCPAFSLKNSAKINYNYSCFKYYDGRHSGYDGCSLLSLGLSVIATMWHQERTTRPKHGSGIVGGNCS